MPCVSVNAGRLAASLSIVIGEYFHVPMVGVWLRQQRIGGYSGVGPAYAACSSGGISSQNSIHDPGSTGPI
jgi:hypothetical protein